MIHVKHYYYYCYYYYYLKNRCSTAMLLNRVRTFFSTVTTAVYLLAPKELRMFSVACHVRPAVAGV